MHCVPRYARGESEKIRASSGLSQSWLTAWSATRPRATFSRMLPAVAVQPCGNVVVDRSEELQELDVAVLGKAGADHLAGGDIQGGERGCGAVALAVMGHCLTATLRRDRGVRDTTGGYDSLHFVPWRRPVLRKLDLGKDRDRLRDGGGSAGYSAARSWGVTTQIPPVWHVATLRPVELIEGVKQHARRNLARADLNEKEIALLELLRAPDVYIESGWADFATKVRDAVRTGTVRESALRSAVATEHNTAVRANFERLENTALVSAA